MYKQCKNPDGTINQFAIICTNDNSFIPFDHANSDYQAYLEWIAEGNTLEPAEGS